jgi:starch-binding outer membrane protein, SusD/RagB family
MKPMMNMRSLALIVGVGLAAAACKDSTSVTDLNNVSAEALAGGLTKASTGLLVTGMLNSTRGDLDSRYLVFSETMARDFYRLDNAENRYITETIGGPADFSGFLGGGAFTQFYVTVRAGNTILNALPSAQGLTAAEVSATRGFVRTFNALALYRALELRDSLGIAIDVNHAIDDPPAGFVCKPSALASITASLDSAATDLAAGGSAFPFDLPPGFSSNGKYNTPATFLQINRGLKGKVELYRALDHQKPNAASLATALTALNTAIGTSAAPAAATLSNGVYNTYSTAAGETRYPIADANIYLNPSVGDSVQAGDLRAAKVLTVAAKSLFNVTSKYKSTLTDPVNLTRPLAIIRVAEMVLLRAQVKIEQGDLVGATADINAVRAGEGGLAPITVPATKDAAISALLYEKRYSLLAESAQRLVDLRAYKRLNATYLKKELPGDIFQSTLPIPKREFDTRGVTTLTIACS